MLVSAMEDRPLVFEGLEDLEPARPRARAARARASASFRAVIAAPNRTAALALGDRTVLLVEAPPPTFAERRQAWADLTGAAGDRRRGRQVPALDRPDRRGRRGVPAGRDRATGARSPTPDELDLGARQASSSRLGELAARIPPGYRWDDLVMPERQRELLQSISAYLRHRDRVLSDWGYEKAVARTQGLKVLFAGESGTGKTMAAQVLAAAARAGDLPRRPRDDRVQVHRGDREEPRPHLRRRRGLERDPVLRRGRRAVRQALGGLGRARPLREHRGRVPAAEDGGLRGRGHPRHELPPQHRRRVRAPARLRDRLPVPRGRGPAPDLGAAAAGRGAAAPTTSTSTSWPSASSSRAARSATARCRRRSRRPTTAA